MTFCPGSGVPIGTVLHGVELGARLLRQAIGGEGDRRFGWTVQILDDGVGRGALPGARSAIGKASPQNRLQRSVGKLPGLSIRIRRMNAAVAGTENQNVNSQRRMKSAVPARLPSGAQ